MKQEYQPIHTESEGDFFVPLRAVCLTPDERSILRKSIERQMQSSAKRSNPVCSVSPWRFFHFVPSHRQVALGTLTLFFISTGASSVAAEQTVPGDVLYPVKVHMNEAVVGAFQRTPEKKAEWEEARAGRRVLEARRLESQGKLSDVKRAELENLINTHTDEIHILRHEKEIDEADSFMFEKETPDDTIRVERSHDDKKYHLRSRTRDDSHQGEE